MLSIFFVAFLYMGQNAPATYKFEVASIKPTAATGNSTGINTAPARFSTSNTSLHTLIVFAYGIHDYQLSGGPGWTRDERYDVSATYDQAENNVPQADQPGMKARNERIRARVRDMLAERFKLKLREETKELPVYGLVIDTKGQKLKVAAEGKGSMSTNRSNGNGTMRGEGVPLKTFIAALGSTLGKPVFDETGLEGLFDFEMKWSDGTGADAQSPTIFTAIREQLGLKLNAKKGPVLTYVIESAEKPSEN